MSKPPSSKTMPQAGDVWRSSHRAGYSVKVLSCKWENYGFGREILVRYKTHETPAKRPQKIPSMATLEHFRQNFTKTYPGLDDI